MTSADVISFVTLAVSVFSAAISVIFSLRAARDTKLQQRGQLIDLKQNYYAKLQEWGDKVVDILTEAIFLCDQDPNKKPNGEYASLWIASRQKLSAAIDQGRFFFPNERPEVHGLEKPPAFRGYRQPILDYLVLAYKQSQEVNYEQLEPNVQLQKLLWSYRQEFVSDVQQILDPRSREEELKTLLVELNR